MAAPIGWLKMPFNSSLRSMKICEKSAKFKNSPEVFGPRLALNGFIMNKQNDNHDNQANAIDAADNSNAVKDPHEWATGDEEMTGAQKSYLKTLSDQAGEELNEKLTKAEASLKIEELQEKTGRGKE